jgi:hypothetical protein
MSDISSDSESLTDTIDTISTRDEKSENKDILDPVNFFNSKELCYYIMIDKFYKSCDINKIEKIKKIIDGESNISLRVLDWFITKFSKKKSNLENCNSDKIFDINLNYKSQLKSYKKKYFDPFRRRKKFNYNYDKQEKTKILYTTLGQLNFFKWAINNDIIEYVENNIDKIVKAMNVSNKYEKEIKLKKLKMKKISSNSIIINKNITDNSFSPDIRRNNKVSFSFDDNLTLTFD